MYDFDQYFTEVCSWKCMISIDISLKFVPKGLNDNVAALIGSYNGLAPIRRQAIMCQAIIWTNVGIVCRHIYVSLGLNELNLDILRISCQGEIVLSWMPYDLTND